MIYESGIEKGGGSKDPGEGLATTYWGDSGTLSQRVVGGLPLLTEGTGCLSIKISYLT